MGSSYSWSAVGPASTGPESILLKTSWATCHAATRGRCSGMFFVLLRIDGQHIWDSIDLVHVRWHTGVVMTYILLRVLRL